MEFKEFLCKPMQNKAYLASSYKRCVLFDAPIDSYNQVAPYLLENHFQLDYIILTHSHFDHIADLSRYKDKFNPSICIHKNDEFRLLNPNEHIPFGFPIKLESVKADKYLEDNEIIKVEDMEFKILHTPGHTDGGICIEIVGERKIITGDTLFKLSVGRTDFTSGDFQLLIKSIKEKLLIYPDDYEVYPGHGDKTTIGYEILYNKFLQ
jgi:glyoxylase-like metal-dependent hydrolase (beta-lactamase superfamily II)